MKERGFLSREDEKWLRKVLDHVCVMKGWKESVDGLAFGLLIAVADNYVVEKYLPLEQKNFLAQLVALGKAKNTKEIQKLVAEELALTNPFLVSVEQAALNFILTAIYEWSDSINQKIEEND